MQAELAQNLRRAPCPSSWTPRAINAGGSNKPFRGGKFSHYEGGHRVPATAWWPGKIKSGSRTEVLALGMDLLPTFADIAGIEVPKEPRLDGTSIKDVLLRQAALPPRKIFFGYEPKLRTAMRDGPWKMIVKGDKVELYDLDHDIVGRAIDGGPSCPTSYP